MALLNYTPPSDNPATGKTLNTTYLAYLTNPTPTTAAAFKAARRTYSPNTTNTIAPAYTLPTHTAKPATYRASTTAYVLPQIVSATPAPQFSAPTSTKPKKTGFFRKMALSSMLLLGIHFSDQLNATYDKIVAKKPQKTHGVGLASFGSATETPVHSLHFANFVTETPTISEAKKPTTPEVKTNEGDNNTTKALSDNPLVATAEDVTHTTTNTPTHTAHSPHLGSVATANESLKDFKSYYAHFMASPKPEGFSPSPEKILTLYNIIKNESPKAGYAEKPTTGGRYDSARHSKKLRGNGGGASGAYQFMASTWVAMGILEKVGKTLKTKPSKAHSVCAALNEKAAKNNEPYVYIPTVNKKGRSTGKYYKLALTDEAKEVSGLENATDIYTTAAGAALQDYGACKLMLSNDKYISYNTKTDPVKYGQACAKLWYHGPKGSNRKPPYAHWHLFKEQLKELTKFNGNKINDNKINTTVYTDTTTQNIISAQAYKL